MSARFTNYLRKKRENPEYRKREKLAEVAADLRILLAEAGLSQRDLAGRLGLSDQALSKKLTGNANLTLETLFDLCDALGKDYEIVYRDKAAKRVVQDLSQTLEGAYVFGQEMRIPARAQTALRPSGDAANESWNPLKLAVA